MNTFFDDVQFFFLSLFSATTEGSGSHFRVSAMISNHGGRSTRLGEDLETSPSQVTFPPKLFTGT